MIQYENDERAIARAIAALGEGETIDHGTARAIASGYSDFRTAHFVSTGYMRGQGDAQWHMDALRRGVDARTLKNDADALNALEAYLTEREAAGEIGRVDGWSDMWVRKHVDRPHEDGALPECWCADDEND
ncbi:hypothetical protein ACIOHE_26460 [Streptomyces sp. NPDC087851]|uniref:hypothetical protein n=1 Tax=Streptomyces sp. NPDC087851 TaxID=3365810 RepID=UPI00381A2A2C